MGKKQILDKNTLNKAVNSISENWIEMKNKIIYGQLIERMCKTHNIEINEAVDILYTAYSIAQDEQSLSIGDKVNMRGGPAMG